MPDIPADLVQLQRAARAATRALYAYRGDDDAERHRLRTAEAHAVLALHAHPERGRYGWRELLAAADDDPGDAAP